MVTMRVEKTKESGGDAEEKGKGGIVIPSQPWSKGSLFTSFEDIGYKVKPNLPFSRDRV